MKYYYIHTYLTKVELILNKKDMIKTFTIDIQQIMFYNQALQDMI